MSFPNLQDFEGWLVEYMAFRGSAAATLGQPVPSEKGQLQLESQRLEPLRWEAERHRALGAGYYYKAKLTHHDKFHKEGWAKTALNDIAKASSYKELLLREDSEGLCRVIDSRAFKVSQHLKLLGAA